MTLFTINNTEYYNKTFHKNSMRVYEIYLVPSKV